MLTKINSFNIKFFFLKNCYVNLVKIGKTSLYLDVFNPLLFKIVTL